MKGFPKNTLPWVLFSSVTALCLYTPFSHWAINAGPLGKYNMGLALFFSFTLPMAIYASLSLAVISVVLAPFFRRSSRRAGNILLLSAFVGLLPLAYILVLDVLAANAG